MVHCASVVDRCSGAGAWLGASRFRARDRLRGASARASAGAIGLHREGRRPRRDHLGGSRGWPADGWLVLDDYHEIVGAEDAEHLVAAVVAASPIQLLIASRLRPTWVSARRILYDEVLELNQTTLAMDAIEASEVLAGRSPPSASGLVALANGWPAVIGLASVTTAEIEDSEQLPEALYRFFAEEVFEALDDEVKAGLATLAVAPILDRELATELMGEGAEKVCGAAIRVGVLVEHGQQLELHPLARSFLDDRCAQLGVAPEARDIARCLACYRRRRDWDAAFDVVARYRLVDKIEPLLLDALDELLSAARLQTIKAWCEVGEGLAPNGSALALARSEVALRQGRLMEAEAFAEIAAEEASEFTFRALSVAGRAAHLASREREALGFYRRAEATAPSQVARRDALWGQLISATDLELPEATALHSALSSSVTRSSTREILQSSAYGVVYRNRFGRPLDLTDVDAAYALIPTIDDPLIVSSFQGVYSFALVLSARYSDAFRVSQELLSTARDYRLDFAVPYALSSAAAACAGQRRWEEAHEYASESLDLFRNAGDIAGQQHAFAVYSRLLVQQREVSTALELEMPSLDSALPAARAEVLASRALVLASAGRTDESSTLIEGICDSTPAILPTVLVTAASAIAAARTNDRDLIGRVVDLEERALSLGVIDFLVTAWRSTPSSCQSCCEHLASRSALDASYDK